MVFPLKFALIATLALLVACRSDPIQFHTLTPAQPSSNTRTTTDIQIESLIVPPQVDRPQIVVRQGNTGMAILETQWWGASLVDELRSALLDQMVNSNPQRKVSVRLVVQRFDSIPGQYGLIDVKWRLRAGDEILMTCRSTLQTPSGPSIDELVAAQQTNVKTPRRTDQPGRHGHPLELPVNLISPGLCPGLSGDRVAVELFFSGC